MVNTNDYISRLQAAIEHLHHCTAHYIETASVQEILQGETVWDGDVEVFALHGHPEAKRCYAWCHVEGHTDDHKHFVTVLEIPPVESPATAIRASLMVDGKKAKRQNEEA